MTIEAYTIASRLTITGDAKQKLESYIRTVKEATLATEKLKRALGLGNKDLEALAAITAKLTPETNRLREVVNRLDSSFGNMSNHLRTVNEQMSASIVKARELSRTFEKTQHSTERGLGGAARSEAAIAKGAAAGFGLGKYGTGAFAVGLGATFFAKKSYESAKEFEQAKTAFAQINLGEKVNQEAFKFAESLNIAGVSVTDALKSLRDSVVVMGDFAHAKQIAPMLAQMEFSNKVAFSGSGKEIGHEQYQDLLRVIEMRGGFKSPAEMGNQANFMQHVLSGTGGVVLPNQYLNFLKTGGVAAQGLTNKAFFYESEPLIQELGGSRLGNMVMSGYQNIVAGRATTAAARHLEKEGLVLPGKAEYDKSGRILRIKPGGIKNSELYQSSYFDWITQVYKPALQKTGLKTEKEMEAAAAIDFPNRNAANLIIKVLRQEEKIKKNVAINEKAKGIYETNEAASKAVAGKEEILSKAFTNLKIAFGELTLPAVLGGMDRLTSFIKDITKVIQVINHPIDTALANFKNPNGAASADKAYGNQFTRHFYDSGANLPVNTGSANKTTTIQNNIHMDGKKVAEVVTQHQTKAATNPPVGQTAFNLYAAPIPVSY